MSSYEFAHSGCAWCHPGGGPLEYDREGYRYDGSGGFFFPSGNPSPEMGDYYAFVPGTGLVDKTSAWQSGGVAEADCLMCHLSVDTSDPQTLNRYSNLERNWVFVSTKKIEEAATFGLVGIGLVVPNQAGGDGVNPNVTSFTWTSIGAGNGVVPGSRIKKTPDKEACALCHFADKSLLKKGPGHTPLGFTSFQKIMPAGTVTDGDERAGVNGQDGLNNEDWYKMKGRAEFGKRGESINDPMNPDAHMDHGFTCSDCHYTIGEPMDPATLHYGATHIPALLDENGNVVQPAVDVLKIDHQFAKGNDKPDGKNMDQLDNTVTCESCHITGSHPGIAKDSNGYPIYNANGNFDLTLSNGSTVEVPVPFSAHAGFPAFHFNQIDCRTCHIPRTNFIKKQLAADYLVGPYRMGARGQFIVDKVNGINYKPLHMWIPKSHEASAPKKLVPIATEAVFVWVDGDKLHPTFQRLGKMAAEAYRSSIGDSDNDGVYDWTLNRPQGGDTAIIVNTQSEINGMISQLQSLGVADPRIQIYVNTFTISHNIAPKDSGMILGDPDNGGCLMCHSSTDPSSPYYSPYSTGFFEGKHRLFNQPTEAGGLHQVGSGATKKVLLELCGVDLAEVGDNNIVNNEIDRTACLGYNATYIAGLRSPGIAGIAVPAAWFSWEQVVESVVNDGFHHDTSAERSGNNVTLTVRFDASASICPSGNCTYRWDFDGDSVVDLNATDPVVEYTYASDGTYDVTLIVFDNVNKTQAIVTNMLASYQAPGSSPAPGGGYEIPVTVEPANKPPVASYTYSVNGAEITVTDQSTDPDGDTLTGIVAWGDGTQDTLAQNGSISHTYSTTGTYKVRYYVSDGRAESERVTEKVVVIVP